MRTLPFAAALLVLVAGTGWAQQPAPSPTPPVFASEVSVTAVSVLVRARDAEGRPIADLDPGELEVREDGVPATVLGLEPLTAEDDASPAAGTAGEAIPGNRRSRVAVYLVPGLSYGGDLKRLLESARTEAEHLLAIGPVTVVVADPEPKVLADGLTDREAVGRSFPPARRITRPRTRIEQIRRDFAFDIGAMASNPRARLARARIAVADEHAALQEALGYLVTWGRSQPSGTGVLLLGIDGFDWTISEYYMRYLEPSASPAGQGTHPGSQRSPGEYVTDYEQAQAELRRYDLEDDVTSAAAALAERGWCIVTFGNLPPTSFPGGADSSGYDERGGALHAGTAPGSFERTVPRRGVLFPVEPLVAMAETTGGIFVKGERGGWPASSLGAALAEIGQSYVLTYQVDRPPDGRIHPLRISTTRPGATVVTPMDVYAGTPEAEARVRAEQTLAGARPRGELPVTMTVEQEATGSRQAGSGRLVVKADLKALRPVLERLRRARLRVTIAVDVGDEPPFVVHDQAEAPVGEGDLWTYEAPLQWPRAARRVAVVVEELATGAWGAAQTTLPRPR